MMDDLTNRPASIPRLELLVVEIGDQAANQRRRAGEQVEVSVLLLGRAERVDGRRTGGELGCVAHRRA
jgi:hypothetical protein